MKKVLFTLFMVAAGFTAAAQSAAMPPYGVWIDTEGYAINAHGAGVLYHDGIYYLYGEFRRVRDDLRSQANDGRNRLDEKGASCYSSPDFKTWRFEGIVLPTTPDDEGSDLHPSMVLERPKVVYNAATGKFVMWMHIDSGNYAKAAAGVAVADSPTGPFTYVESFRPNDAMSRDQTVFVDDDGRAYQFTSSEHNRTLYINELTADYLRPTGRYTRNFIDTSREAPAVFKHAGKYYLLSSGCSGWDPNEAQLAVADSVMGPWTVIGNPCTGPGAEKTFLCQSTYVQPVRGKENLYVAMFDRWNKHNLQDSRYVWLPVKFGADGTVTIPWVEEWNIDTYPDVKP